MGVGIEYEVFWLQKAHMYEALPVLLLHALAGTYAHYNTAQTRYSCPLESLSGKPRHRALSTSSSTVGDPEAVALAPGRHQNLSSLWQDSLL